MQVTKPILKPFVPFKQPHRLEPNGQVFVVGKVGKKMGGGEFQFNLRAGNDIAMHIGVRFNGRVIVRNTKQGNGWQSEERGGDFPFFPGQMFELVILTTPTEYRVAVNGEQLFTFNHRMAWQAVDAFEVLGDVKLKQVSLGQPGFKLTGMTMPAMPQPAYNPVAQMTHQMSQQTLSSAGRMTSSYTSSQVLTGPPVPLYHRLSLRPGSRVTIYGATPFNANRFQVNFLSQRDIAAHFGVRFDESVVVRNCERGGRWESEERNGPPFPFAKGQPFEILIQAEGNAFMLAVSGRHFAAFNHRVPLHAIDQLSIEGNVSLSQVRIE